MISVYHFETKGRTSEDDIFMVVIGGSNMVGAIARMKAAGCYTKVAEVESTNLEEAYALTQNISDSWSMSPPKGLTLTAPLHVENGETYGRRSSMMGDLFELDGKFFYCAMIGFKELA